MDKYKIICRDPVTGETYSWASNDYVRAIAGARYDHACRGLLVTVVCAKNGCVMISLGADLSAEI